MEDRSSEERHHDLENVRSMYDQMNRGSKEEHARVGWQTAEGQRKRFDAIVNGLPHGFVPDEILDVGCGTGVFAKYVAENFRKPRHRRIAYTGIDICEAFINTAKARYGHHGGFRHRDVSKHLDIIGENSYDLVVGCGTVGFYKNPFPVLIDMWKLTGRVLVFNWYEGTSVLDLRTVLAFAVSQGCDRWVISHNYHPKDYTIHMWKTS